jgi:glycosyltransferase involved in cell wall biosynthesis
MEKSGLELAVVMPVYNEEAIVGQVLADWSAKLTALGIDYRIHAYNDGSKDSTARVLDQAAAADGRVQAHHKPNSGHGPTILQGYIENCNAQWIFQVDSDNEMKPADFECLWRERARYDFLIGERAERESPPMRRIISATAFVMVRLLCGAGVRDVNSPFRLMRSDVFRDHFLSIPRDTFAPNVLVSAIVGQNRIRVFRVPVAVEGRKTGTVSIKNFKLLKAAVRSFMQTVQFRFRGKGGCGA